MSAFWQRRHLVLAAAWAVLVIPAVLWWADSIIFVILLSLYANFEASLAAHHALVSENGNGGEQRMCEGCSDSAGGGGKVCEDELTED